MEIESEVYKKFCVSGQEKIRLQAALNGLFLENRTEEHTADYEKYLRRRIRPAMEFLITGEDIQKMEALEKYHWFGETELDRFLEYAREHRKFEAFVWLLKLKDEKYGYKERKYPF